jgi:hypothetical protein
MQNKTITDLAVAEDTADVGYSVVQLLPCVNTPVPYSSKAGIVHGSPPERPFLVPPVAQLPRGASREYADSAVDSTSPFHYFVSSQDDNIHLLCHLEEIFCFSKNIGIQDTEDHLEAFSVK